MTAARQWVVRRRTVPRPRLRLFLFAHGGGGPSSYLGWDTHFPPDVELCAVQLPGREGRFSEPPFRRLEALVADAAVALAPLMTDSFALFGHSMGALVAYEVARQVSRQGGPTPAAFFASGYPGPRVARHHRPPLHTLQDDALIEQLRRLGGIPDEVLVAPELVRLCLPVVRADFEVCETWMPPLIPGLSCPVLALGGYEDSSVDPDGLDAWRLETTGPFSRAQVPGGHFYHSNPSTRGPLLDVLLASLSSRLAA